MINVSSLMHVLNYIQQKLQLHALLHIIYIAWATLPALEKNCPRKITLNILTVAICKSAAGRDHYNTFYGVILKALMILADRRHPHLYNFITCSNNKKNK